MVDMAGFVHDAVKLISGVDALVDMSLTETDVATINSSLKSLENLPNTIKQLTEGTCDTHAQEQLEKLKAARGRLLAWIDTSFHPRADFEKVLCKIKSHTSQLFVGDSEGVEKAAGLYTGCGPTLPASSDAPVGEVFLTRCFLADKVVRDGSHLYVVASLRCCDRFCQASFCKCGFSSLTLRQPEQLIMLCLQRASIIEISISISITV